MRFQARFKWQNALPSPFYGVRGCYPTPGPKDDSTLAEIIKSAQRERRATILAREGMTIEL